MSSRQAPPRAPVHDQPSRWDSAMTRVGETESMAETLPSVPVSGFRLRRRWTRLERDNTWRDARSNEPSCLDARTRVRSALMATYRTTPASTRSSPPKFPLAADWPSILSARAQPVSPATNTAETIVRRLIALPPTGRLGQIVRAARVTPRKRCERNRGVGASPRPITCRGMSDGCHPLS